MTTIGCLFLQKLCKKQERVFCDSILFSQVFFIPCIDLVVTRRRFLSISIYRMLLVIIVWKITSRLLWNEILCKFTKPKEEIGKQNFQ